MADIVDRKNSQTNVAMNDHRHDSIKKKLKSTPLFNVFKRCYFQELLTYVKQAKNK